MKPLRPAGALTPLLMALTLFAVLTMVLVERSNQRWDLALRDSMIAFDRLSESRRVAALAELHVERWLGGDPSADPALVVANLERALDAARGLAEGRGQLAGFSMARSPSTALADASGAHLANVEALAVAIRDRLTDPTATSGLVLRERYRRVEASAVRVEDVLLGELAQRRRTQHRLDAVNIMLVAGLTAALFGILARLERRRTNALRELVASEARLRVQTRLYHFLSQVNQSIVLARTRDELFARALSAALNHGHFAHAWITLTEVSTADEADSRADLTWRVEPPDAAPPFPSDAITPAMHEVWQHGRNLIVVDLDRLPSPEAWQRRLVDAGMNTYAGLPMFCGQHLVGVLHLASAHIDLDAADEQALLHEVAGDLSFALNGIDTRDQREAQAARLALLAAAVESSRDGIMITDLDTRIVSINKAFTDLTGFGENEALGRTPAILRSGMHDDAFYRDMMSELRRAGHWQGELWNRRRNGELIAQFLTLHTVPDANGRPARFVGVMTDLTTLKEAQDRVATLTHYDPLTGLANRSLIRSTLAHALIAARRRATRVAVLFIDIDHFRMVNDGLGHAAGDALLNAVARRLAGRLRRQDTLGRQSGDEFVAVLEDLAHADDAARVAADLQQACQAPFTLDAGAELFAQVSIGIALHPEHGGDAGDLIRNAESAMHQVKRDGRGSWRLYAPDLTAAASSRLSLEARLRRALQLGQFALHYQPVVNLTSGAIVGAEALVRLADAGPPLGPARFIPLMEETGLILPLGEWVQHNACRQAKTWLDTGRLPGFIAINLSATEIRSGTTEAQLRRILEDTGLPAKHLELEVTESGLMGQGERAEDFLRGLKSLGVRLSIDDFGTGYSSLAYLRRFPVDKLKIDRSFIVDVPRDRGDAQLTAAIIGLAHTLGLSVLAEGVESDAQRDFLGAQGCEAWQGYLCSPPLAAEAFAERFLAPPNPPAGAAPA